MLRENVHQKLAHNRTGKSYRATRLFITLVFALSLFPVKAHAQILGDLEAKVPFTFHVGDTKLPAGTYRIHVFDGNDPSLMEITSADGSTSALFHVQDSEANNTPRASELIFNRYGHHYFLSRLFDAGNPNGSELEKSRYETRLVDAAAESQVVQQHVPAHHRGASGK
ncbi:MAG TPA: hypothetical protein VMU53_19105 [Candidatus Sulfotelmatobacter sp.]|nr:hypothetical protein [Candidatus Sulfotelmatobacter sp.]